MKSIYLLSGVLIISIAFISISMGKEAGKMENLRIESPAFEGNGQIPQKYTCDGDDVNPPLKIGGVPASAKSLALIVDDPDAPGKTWVHWVVWNMTPDTSEIKEDSVPKGAAQGMNDFRKNSYGGPCPPSGTHRYFFKLYALDTVLELGSHSTKADLESAMRGHTVGQTELIGLYRRQ
ncbi:MAG: YbhB/YbcL family Raf kinase inhibitor-like protein [Candidatus Sulfobium sp.]